MPDGGSHLGIHTSLPRDPQTAHAVGGDAQKGGLIRRSPDHVKLPSMPFHGPGQDPSGWNGVMILRACAGVTSLHKSRLVESLSCRAKTRMASRPCAKARVKRPGEMGGDKPPPPPSPPPWAGERQIRQLAKTGSSARRAVTLHSVAILKFQAERHGARRATALRGCTILHPDSNRWSGYWRSHRG